MTTIGIDVRLTYYRQGGIAEYMRQLVNALGRLDSPFAYKTLHHFRSQETLTPSRAFRRVNCYTPCHHWLESIALGVELLPQRLDLLHSPDFIPPRWGAKRRVITVHDLAFLLYPNIQTRDSLRYYAGQIRRAVREADHILAVSQATKTDLIELLGVSPEKVTVTGEGVHPQYKVLDQEQVTAKLSSYSLHSDYLLFVGTIEPRKNIPNLLRGYAILKTRCASLPSLVLVGQRGWLAEASFQTISDLNLSDDVIWLENVPFDALPALYNGARLHLLPSLYEGFGFPPLEAMACGTPTIVSDRGALPEICGEAALYVDPEQPEAIADAIERLLSDSSLSDQMRQKGLQHVRQFTWSATAEQTLAVYKAVLSQ